MRVATIGLLMLLWAGVASAQDASTAAIVDENRRSFESIERPRRMPTAHKVAVAVYVAGAASDLHSTYLVLSRGGFEKNPLGRLTNSHPVGTVIMGAGVDAVATALLYRWLGKEHPKLTTVLLYSAAAVRVGYGVHNYRELR